MPRRLDPDQTVVQVPPLPRPQSQIPGVDFSTPVPAANPEHTGAMLGRNRQGALQVTSREELRAVALDDPNGTRMLRQRRRDGELTVDDQPGLRVECGD